MWALPHRARTQPIRTNERSFLLGLDAQAASIDFSSSDTAAVDCTAGVGLTVWKFVLSHKPQAAELEQEDVTASTPATQEENPAAETECHDDENDDDNDDDFQDDEDDEGENEVDEGEDQLITKTDDTLKSQSVHTENDDDAREDDVDDNEHDDDDEDDVDGEEHADEDDVDDMELADENDADDEEHRDEDNAEAFEVASLGFGCSTPAPQVVNLSELEAASSTHDLPPALSALLNAERSARKMLLLKDSSHAWETESDMTDWSSIADNDECHSNAGSRRSHRSTQWRAIGHGRYARG